MTGKKKTEEEMESIEAELADETAEEVEEAADVQETEAIPDPIQDQLLRLQADFQNFRKRSEREKEDIVRYANEGLIIKLLNVADNFERAIQSEKEHDAFFEGMELVYADFRKVLQSAGLEEIESDGAAFDPQLHHAVITEEHADFEAGKIIETFQKGYRLNGKVIRPAMVKVAK